jgi:hypothetical protein
MAAQYRDRGARAHELSGDFTTDAAAAAGDQRMGGMRQSGHAQAPRCRFTGVRFAYILNFKLLQETG